MSAPDMDVIKEIPGYKVILKAVLKMQIQQLVEHLASHTDEESVILTASVSDGTLSHLGSDSGKNFLDDHEDIKSQFLGFCLKRHHKKKQQEKEREALTSPPKMKYTGGPRYGSPRMPVRSPRYSSPPGVHPVALTRASPGSQMRSPGPRHEPYPMARPPRRSSLNFDQPGPSTSGSAMKLPVANKIDNQIIKIEPDDDTNESDSKQSETNIPSTSQPTSPSQNTAQASDKDDETSNLSSVAPPSDPNTSELRFSDTQPAEGLSLDSDLSNLISSETNNSATLEKQGNSTIEVGASETDPTLDVKVEAITESEMELEITGVELGHNTSVDPMRSQDSWAQQGTPQGGATGSPADLQGAQQGYSNERLSVMQVYINKNFEEEMTPGLEVHKVGSKFEVKSEVDAPTVADLDNTTGPEHRQLIKCRYCEKYLYSSSTLYTHMRCYHPDQPKGNVAELETISVSLPKFPCSHCDKTFMSFSSLKRHMRNHTGDKPFQCKICSKTFTRKDYLKSHQMIHYIRTPKK